MTNHVHLLLTAKTIDGLGRLMKRLGQRYVQYINRNRNRTYRRSGTLWEGRFRSCLTQEEAYVLGGGGLSLHRNESRAGGNGRTPG
ncbi:transposase [Salinisphaera sp. SPP-AMP-43]